MSASSSFESRWRVPVPPQRAWAELVRALAPGTGPRWWPGVTLLMAPRRLLPGERMTVVVRSPLGYRLRMRLEFTEVDRGRAIAARSDGDLQGSGRVEIRADGAAAGPRRPEAPGDAPAERGGGREDRRRVPTGRRDPTRMDERDGVGAAARVRARARARHGPRGGRAAGGTGRRLTFGGPKCWQSSASARPRSGR